MLIATVYAPLFHVHMGESGESALIHAHFPEPEIADADGKPHIESRHSHSEARSIDILTTTATPFVQLDTVILTTHTQPDAGYTCCGFVSVEVPRAHSPPGLRSLIPRAPPA